MTEPTELAQLRHLYQNMVNGAVRDTASAKRIAEGLLAPAIEALERGTPPAVVGEPVATIKSWTNGSYWRNYKVEWHRNDLPEGAHLYTTPQPTQAQAGAVPLTDEQWQRIADLTDSILTRATKDEIERVIGIKGGQHGAE